MRTTKCILLALGFLISVSSEAQDVTELSGTQTPSSTLSLVPIGQAVSVSHLWTTWSILLEKAC